MIVGDWVQGDRQCFEDSRETIHDSSYEADPVGISRVTTSQRFFALVVGDDAERKEPVRQTHEG